MLAVELIEMIHRWLESASRHRVESVANYLAVIHESCQQLLTIEPGITDESRFLQERIRALYSDASLVLASRLRREDVKLVFDALASARIYYWIRILDLGASEDFGSLKELHNLIIRRGGPVGGGLASLTIVERALLAMCGPNSDGGAAIERLRVACLRDFAAVDMLRTKYPSA